jgi:hypothetical protein
MLDWVKHIIKLSIAKQTKTLEIKVNEEIINFENVSSTQKQAHKC